MNLWQLSLFAFAATFAQPPELDFDIVASGLPFPSAFTFAPDGTIYFTGLGGGIVGSLPPDTRKMNVLAQINTKSSGDGAGPIGIALDPDFGSKNYYLYVFVSGNNETGVQRNNIFRYSIINNKAWNKTTIFTSEGLGGFESGGKMIFGPDKKLWITSGQQFGTEQDLLDVQRWNSQTGKILRLNADGTYPKNNPYGKGVWARGVRNSFGITFDPLKKGRIWVTEPGPDCNDEINLLIRGGNNGWGRKATCSVAKYPNPKNTNQDGPKINYPKLYMNYDPVLFPSEGNRPPSPTGLVICRKCGLGSFYEGRMLFGTFGAASIYVVRINTKQRNKLGEPKLVLPNFAPVLAVERGNDGSIYYSDVAGFIKKLKLKETA